MKYLIDENFINIQNEYLSCYDLGDKLISGILEFGKLTDVDKSLYEQIKSNLLPIQKQNINSSALLKPIPSSPLGPVSESRTQKLLMHLISCLNMAFNDYDFSNPELLSQFSYIHRHSDVINHINTLIIQPIEHIDPHSLVRQKLWAAIRQAINFDNCEIYCFQSDGNDIFGIHKIWSFVYFFLDHSCKKIVLFCVCAILPDRASSCSVSSYNNLENIIMDDNDVWEEVLSLSFYSNLFKDNNFFGKEMEIEVNINAQTTIYS